MIAHGFGFQDHWLYWPALAVVAFAGSWLWDRWRGQ